MERDGKSVLRAHQTKEKRRCVKIYGQGDKRNSHGRRRETKWSFCLARPTGRDYSLGGRDPFGREGRIGGGGRQLILRE